MATTVNVRIQFKGAREAASDLALLRKELRKLDGAKATVHIDYKEPSIATKSMIVDADFVNRALRPGMKLDPLMIAPYINRDKILPDKMAMFVAGINRELAKEQERNKGSRHLIKSRKEFIDTYGPEFLYFRSKVGKPLNKAVTDIIRKA